MSLRTSRSNAGSEVVANGIGNQKLCVLRPSVVALGEADFLFAQRLAMSRRGILPVGRAGSDVTIQNDEGRTPFGLAKDGQGAIDQGEIGGISDAHNVP